MLAVNVHSVLDYLWGSALALFPYVVGFQNITAGRNFFLFLGIFIIFYSLLTQYRFSIFKVLPFGLHRIFDIYVGGLVAVAPSLFNYVQYLSIGQHIAHIILGLVTIGMAILTRTETLTELLSSPDQAVKETGLQFQNGIGKIEDKPEERSSDVWAILTSVATIILVIFISIIGNHKINQEAGRTSKNWKFTAPNNIISQAPGSQPLPLDHFIPKAQQGINPAEATITVELETEPNIPAFSREKITVRSGEIVKLIFKNMSAVNHFDNFVLVLPKTEDEVGEAGLRAGPDVGYIPVLPNDIIAHSKTIAPGDTDTVIFRAPSEPGLYPYISTFPRRWKAMRGVLEVK